MSTRTFVAKHDSRIGAKLGKYRITARIGRGGMGIVYAAADTLLQRPVALKVLPESVADDPTTLRRFLREAQAAARLNHPHVVSIYEVDRAADTYYIAMELVRADSVQDFLRSHGRFSWQEATRIALEACRGMAAAHTAGLIHRDIKPANIMRSREGVIKLADFGLAHVVDQEGLSQGFATLVGTPDYMSPEQCRCDDLDERSDVYALGATYYAMLVGRPPFSGGAPLQIMFAQCSQAPPDPRDAEPSVPETCAAIVRKAMAKSRKERFSSAEELAAALEATLAAHPSEPMPPKWHEQAVDPPSSGNVLDDAQRWLEASSAGSRTRLRNRLAVIVGGVAILVAAGFAVMHKGTMRDSSAGSVVEAVVTAPTADGLTGASSFRRSITAEGLVLKLDSAGTLLAVSPDGQWLLAGGKEGDTGIRVWSLTTGELMSERRFRLPRDRFNQELTAAAFGPLAGNERDGCRLALAARYDGGNELSIWDLNTELAPQRVELGNSCVSSLAFSAGGDLLAAACNDPKEKDATIRLWGREPGRELTAISIDEPSVRWLSFCATAPSRLAFAAGKRVQLVDTTGARPSKILEPFVGPSHGTFAARGDLLAVAGMNYVRLRHVDGDDNGRLLETPAGSAECVAIAPDGAWIAVGGGTERSGLVTIFDTAGRRNPIALRGHEKHVRALVFLPSGDIVVSTGDDRTVRLWDIRRILADNP
jgi:serine/threonine protein kinase